MYDLSRLLLLTMTAGVFGCGTSGKVGPLKMTKPPTQNISNGTATGLADGCTAATCPKSDVVVEVNGARASSIAAQVGQSANYSIKARSSQFPGRLFSVLAMTPSPAVASMGILAAQSAISWLPLASDITSGGVQLKVRDLTRCQKLSQPAVAGNCAMPNFSLPEFDTVTTVPFSVTNATASSLPTTPATTGNNSGGLGGGLGGILGGLIGQGGGLGGLGGGIGGGGGGNVGGTSGSQFPPPNGGDMGTGDDTGMGDDEEFPE